MNEKYIDVCKYRDELLRQRAGLRKDLTESQELIDALQGLLEEKLQAPVVAPVPAAVQFVELVRAAASVP